jgi:DNA-binding protein HU-beta
MKKSDIIAGIAKLLGIPNTKAEKAFDHVFSSITHAIVEEGSITISNFGTFSVSDRAAREGRNPQTGETIKIPSSRVPRFKAASKLKEIVKSGVSELKTEKEVA